MGLLLLPVKDAKADLRILTKPTSKPYLHLRAYGISVQQLYPTHRCPRPSRMASHLSPVQPPKPELLLTINPRNLTLLAHIEAPLLSVEQACTKDQRPTNLLLTTSNHAFQWRREIQFCSRLNVVREESCQNNHSGQERSFERSFTSQILK